MEFHLFLNALSVAANLYGDACAGTVFGQLLLERWEAGHRDAVDGFDAVAGLQARCGRSLPSEHAGHLGRPGSRWSTWMPKVGPLNAAEFTQIVHHLATMEDGMANEYPA